VKTVTVSGNGNSNLRLY